MSCESEFFSSKIFVKNFAYDNKFEFLLKYTIKKLGGTMPENLPTPEKSIKQLEKEELKKIEMK